MTSEEYRKYYDGLSKKEDKPKLSLVKNESIKYKIIIPNDVENKIRFICNRIWEVEWSGVLFYDYKGKFEDGSLEIICKDIFVMDIGNSSYTEFIESPDIASYIAENIELVDYQMGLIHSHNNMSTFFSGTDVETLNLEGEERNIFVSLIVNNRGDYTAAITRCINEKNKIVSNISYEMFGDGPVKYKQEEEEENKYIEYFYLDVIKNGFKNIDNRLSDIKVKKDAKSNKQYNLPLFSYPSNGNTGFVNKPDKSNEPSAKELIYEYNKKNKKEADLFDIDDEKVKKIAINILTGSITISNIDLNKFIPSMESIYDKKFGNNKKGLKDFEDWIDFLLDYILLNSYVNPNNYREYDFTSELAHKLIKFMGNLKSNKYIDIIITKLNLYLN